MNKTTYMFIKDNKSNRVIYFTINGFLFNDSLAPPSPTRKEIWEKWNKASLIFSRHSLYMYKVIMKDFWQHRYTSFESFIRRRRRWWWCFFFSNRCKLPNYPNDTFLSQGPAHDDLIKAFIPTELSADNDVIYKQCYVFSTPGSGNVTGGPEQSCSAWVYDRTVYENTFASEV